MFVGSRKAYHKNKECTALDKPVNRYLPVYVDVYLQDLNRAVLPFARPGCLSVTIKQRADKELYTYAFSPGYHHRTPPHRR